MYGVDTDIYPDEENPYEWILKQVAWRRELVSGEKPYATLYSWRTGESEWTQGRVTWIPNSG